MILAAGAGRRFGGAKLGTRWGDRALVEHVIAAVVKARRVGLVDQAWVVHAPGDGAVLEAARAAGLGTVAAAQAQQGISASLAAGFAALGGAGAGAGDAVFVLLGDQPAVRVEVLRRLLEVAHPLERALVRPRYGADPGVPGHPVLIGREHWPLVREAAGDRGLDPVLAAHGLRWRYVDVPGANPDIDTAADLERLTDHEGERRG